MPLFSEIEFSSVISSRMSRLLEQLDAARVARDPHSVEKASKTINMLLMSSLKSESPSDLAYIINKMAIFIVDCYESGVVNLAESALGFNSGSIRNICGILDGLNTDVEVEEAGAAASSGAEEKYTSSRRNLAVSLIQQVVLYQIDLPKLQKGSETKCDIIVLKRKVYEILSENGFNIDFFSEDIFRFITQDIEARIREDFDTGSESDSIYSVFIVNKLERAYLFGDIREYVDAVRFIAENLVYLAQKNQALSDILNKLLKFNNTGLDLAELADEDVSELLKRVLVHMLSPYMEPAHVVAYQNDIAPDVVGRLSVKYEQVVRETVFTDCDLLPADPMSIEHMIDIALNHRSVTASIYAYQELMFSHIKGALLADEDMISRTLVAFETIDERCKPEGAGYRARIKAFGEIKKEGVETLQELIEFEKACGSTGIDRLHSSAYTLASRAFNDLPVLSLEGSRFVDELVEKSISLGANVPALRISFQYQLIRAISASSTSLLSEIIKKMTALIPDAIRENPSNIAAVFIANSKFSIQLMKLISSGDIDSNELKNLLLQSSMLMAMEQNFGRQFFGYHTIRVYDSYTADISQAAVIPIHNDWDSINFEHVIVNADDVYNAVLLSLGCIKAKELRDIQEAHMSVWMPSTSFEPDVDKTLSTLEELWAKEELGIDESVAVQDNLRNVIVACLLADKLDDVARIFSFLLDRYSELKASRTLNVGKVEFILGLNTQEISLVDSALREGNKVVAITLALRAALKNLIISDAEEGSYHDQLCELAFCKLGLSFAKVMMSAEMVDRFLSEDVHDNAYGLANIQAALALSSIAAASTKHVARRRDAIKFLSELFKSYPDILESRPEILAKVAHSTYLSGCVDCIGLMDVDVDFSSGAHNVLLWLTVTGAWHRDQFNSMSGSSAVSLFVNSLEERLALVSTGDDRLIEYGDVIESDGVVSLDKSPTLVPLVGRHLAMNDPTHYANFIYQYSKAVVEAVARGEHVNVLLSSPTNVDLDELVRVSRGGPIAVSALVLNNIPTYHITTLGHIRWGQSGGLYYSSSPEKFHLESRPKLFMSVLELMAKDLGLSDISKIAEGYMDKTSALDLESILLLAKMLVTVGDHEDNCELAASGIRVFISKSVELFKSEHPESQAILMRGLKDLSYDKLHVLYLHLMANNIDSFGALVIDCIKPIYRKSTDYNSEKLRDILGIIKIDACDLINPRRDTSYFSYDASTKADDFGPEMLRKAAEQVSIAAKKTDINWSAYGENLSFLYKQSPFIDALLPATDADPRSYVEMRRLFRCLYLLHITGHVFSLRTSTSISVGGISVEMEGSYDSSMVEDVVSKYARFNGIAYADLQERLSTNHRFTERMLFSEDPADKAGALLTNAARYVASISTDPKRIRRLEDSQGIVSTGCGITIPEENSGHAISVSMVKNKTTDQWYVIVSDRSQIVHNLIGQRIYKVKEGVEISRLNNVFEKLSKSQVIPISLLSFKELISSISGDIEHEVEMDPQIAGNCGFSSSAKPLVLNSVVYAIYCSYIDSGRDASESWSFAYSMAGFIYDEFVAYNKLLTVQDTVDFFDSEGDLDPTEVYAAILDSNRRKPHQFTSRIGRILREKGFYQSDIRVMENSLVESITDQVLGAVAQFGPGFASMHAHDFMSFIRENAREMVSGSSEYHDIIARLQRVLCGRQTAEDLVREASLSLSYSRALCDDFSPRASRVPEGALVEATPHYGFDAVRRDTHRDGEEFEESKGCEADNVSDSVLAASYRNRT